MRDSHVGHFVERKVMPVLEEDWENPRMRFIRSEQSNDIFAAGTHVAIRAKRRELFGVLLDEGGRDA